jgi:hypothetical protein
MGIVVITIAEIRVFVLAMKRAGPLGWPVSHLADLKNGPSPHLDEALKKLRNRRYRGLRLLISAQSSRRVTPFNPPPNQGYAERRSPPHSVRGQKHAYVLTTFRGLPGSGERVRARRHETGPRLARISGARPLPNAGHIYERGRA